MCGRFFRHGVTWADYRAWLNLIPPDEIDPPEPTYNAAPGSYQPILRRHREGHVEIAPALWGLVPSWWKKPLKEKTFTSFNAKCETLAEKPVFRGAFRHHRCLVPMSGYYEWTGRQGAKTPFAIGLRNRRHFCLAGLYDVAHIDGSELHSFTILTTSPNDATAGVHHRMPVILHTADLGLCLTAPGLKSSTCSSHFRLRTCMSGRSDRTSETCETIIPVLQRRPKPRAETSKSYQT